MAMGSLSLYSADMVDGISKLLYDEKSNLGLFSGCILIENLKVHCSKPL